MLLIVCNLRMEFLPIVNAFKAARLFNPEKVSDLIPTASTIEVFAFLVNVISNLKTEFYS